MRPDHCARRPNHFFATGSGGQQILLAIHLSLFRAEPSSVAHMHKSVAGRVDSEWLEITLAWVLTGFDGHSPLTRAEAAFLPPCATKCRRWIIAPGVN